MSFKICCSSCPHKADWTENPYENNTYKRLYCSHCGARNPEVLMIDTGNEANRKFDEFESKFEGYKDEGFINSALNWLKQNFLKVKELIDETPVSKFIFEPFQGVLNNKPDIIESDIYRLITKIAIINAALAGLPGKMGVGVFVSMGLEIWMGIRIAQYIGFKEIKNVGDIGRYIGLIGTLGFTVVEGFKIILGFIFSLASALIPIINPLIIAEIVATNIIGLIWLFGFQNILHAKKFNEIKISSLLSMTQKLTRHQLKFIRNVANTDNLKSAGKRLQAFFSGDFPVDPKVVNGELFSTVAMAYLIAGKYEKLEGPLGESFIEAIRLRWSSQLGDSATIDEISEHFQQYDISQLEGAANTIKGKMFEILVTNKENSDGDSWEAKMHEDESFPGSDIVFYNPNNGDHLEVSLKAVSEDNTYIIEDALAKYPNLPIMTTDEVAELYEDNPNVFGSGFTNKDLDGITDDKLQILISQMEPINAKEVVVGGITMSTFGALWPFVMAYLRKRITEEQLEKVFFQVMGDSGIKLVARLSWAILLGPMFAWWLLARGVSGIVDMASPDTLDNEKTTKISFVAITN